MMESAGLTKKAGICVHGCFMIGGPGEIKRTAEKTINLAKRLKPDTLQFSGLTPYPGTQFYYWCKEKGYVIAEDWTDWVDAGEQSTVIAYLLLSKEEIYEKGIR